MTYRGKYPKRINTVSSLYNVSGAFVQLNDGEKIVIAPLTSAARAHMPKPGEDVVIYADNDDNYSIEQFDVRNLFVGAVVAEFIKFNPDWTPDVGAPELALRHVVTFLIADGQITTLALTRLHVQRLARALADYVSI